MRWICAVITLLFMVSPVWADFDLVVYSGAGLMKPLEELRTDFENEHKVKIQAHYAGSGEIFGLLSIGRCCDIFIPGAKKYIRDAEKNGWIKPETIVNIVKHVPVIVVPKGNPGNIKTLSDLASPDVKITLGDPRACAIGKVAKKILQKNALYEKVKQRVAVAGPTVNQLLIYVAMNRVQGAIIWEDVVSWAKDNSKVEVIQIPEQNNLIKTVPCAVTACSKNPVLAKKFNLYISSDKSAAIWEKWGFKRCTK